MKKLKEKRDINNGKDQDVMDMSELRKMFNIDLEKRHDRSFGMD